MDEKVKQGESSGQATKYEAQSHSELLNYMNIQPEFREVIADLSGTRWDYANQKFVTDEDTKALVKTDEGIRAIVRALRAYFSKSAVINDFDDVKISKLMKSWRVFIKKILVYPSIRERYGIDARDRVLIAEILTTAAFLNLNRSLDGGERDSITKIIKSREEVKQSMRAKSPGLASPLNLIRGKKN